MKFLKMPANKFVKSMVYNADGKLVMALLQQKYLFMAHLIVGMHQELK